MRTEQEFVLTTILPLLISAAAFGLSVWNHFSNLWHQRSHQLRQVSAWLQKGKRSDGTLGPCVVIKNASGQAIFDVRVEVIMADKAFEENRRAYQKFLEIPTTQRPTPVPIIPPQSEHPIHLDQSFPGWSLPERYFYPVNLTFLGPDGRRQGISTKNRSRIMGHKMIGLVIVLYRKVEQLVRKN